MPEFHRNSLKLLIWTVIPTHHQSSFFDAIRTKGIDLVVHYFGEMSTDRRLLGWSVPPLTEGEHRVPALMSSLKRCPDWKDRLHILPGYNRAFLLGLACLLSIHRVRWLHWSEPSRPMSHAWLTEPVRRCYGLLVDRYALGALAIGDMAARSFVKWGISPDKIRFLPYAVSAPNISPLRTAPDPLLPSEVAQAGGLRIRFLFLGALCHRKGIDVLIHALGIVRRHSVCAHLDLVGHDHSGGAYARLISELGLREGVQIRASVPSGAVGNIIAACDIFILPSRFDGWGMVLNEAAAAGKPLISTDMCGAAHHLIHPGKNGFRVEAEAPGALADAMLQYCARPELIAAHGAHSRALFENFTPQRNAERLLAAVESLSGVPR